MVAGASVLGACQVLTGLSGLHEETSRGTGGSTSSASAGKGGASTSASEASASAASSTAASTTASTAASGGCGQDCGPGGCDGGVCQAYQVGLASGTLGVDMLASDGAFVYWGIKATASSNGSIWRAPVNGSLAMTGSLVVDQIAPIGMAVDKLGVYWNSSGKAILAADPSTTTHGGNLLWAETSEISPSIAALGGFVYWAVPSEDRIAYLTDEVDAGKNPIDVVANQVGLDAFAMDARYVYYFETADMKRAPLDMFMSPNVIGPVAPHDVLAADEDDMHGYVYWTVTGQGAVMRLPKGGPMMADQIDSGLKAPSNIVADVGGAYWADHGTGCGNSDGLVRQLPKGGSVSTLKGKVDCPVVAMDAQAVYWSDGPQIWRQVR